MDHQRALRLSAAPATAASGSRRSRGEQRQRRPGCASSQNASDRRRASAAAWRLSASPRAAETQRPHGAVQQARNRPGPTRARAATRTSAPTPDAARVALIRSASSSRPAPPSATPRKISAAAPEDAACRIRCRSSGRAATPTSVGVDDQPAERADHREVLPSGRSPCAASARGARAQPDRTRLFSSHRGSSGTLITPSRRPASRERAASRRAAVRGRVE